MLPTLSPDQIPEMISSPQFGALPHAERTRISEEALAHGAQTLAGTWDQPTYQKWGQFANTVRGKVAGMESMGEQAAGVGGVVLDAARSMGRMAIAGAADLSLMEPDASSMRMPGGNIAEQAGLGMRKIGDTLNTWASGGKLPLERDLKKLREDVDKGNLPLDNVDKLGTWLEDRSAALGKSQEHLYNKIQGGEPWPADYVQTNGLMNPNHAALLSRYIQTRDPATWDTLEKSLKKAPNRAKIEQEQGTALENSSMVNFLTQSLGTDYAEPMVGAGDPILLAMTAFPPVRAAMAAKAAMAGTEVGAVAAAKGLAKSAGIGAGLGVAMTAENDPNATWEDYKLAAKDMVAISLGFHGAGMAVGKLGQKIQQARGGPAAAPTPTTAPINEPQPPSRPATEPPVTTGEAPRTNPFDGPIEAPPQPVESGGLVPEPKSLPQPTSQGIGQSMSDPTRPLPAEVPFEPAPAGLDAPAGNLTRIISTGKPNGARVEAVIDFVEAADLKPLLLREVGSDQTRDRANNRGSSEQVAAIAASPDALLLGDSPVSSMGAPVVDDVILAGNGRAEGLIQGYQGGGAGISDYRANIVQQAKAMGRPEVAQMRQPVMIRRVQKYVSGDRRDFVKESNPKYATLQETVAEAALLDAEVLGDLSGIEFTEAGSLTSSSLQQVATKLKAAQRGVNATTGGKPDVVEATRRVQQAALAKLAKDYGMDVSDLSGLLETDVGRRTVAEVTKTAPRLAALEKDLGLGEEMLTALQSFSQGARAVSQGLFKNLNEWAENRGQELIRDSLTPEAGAILEVMIETVRTPTKLRELFNNYLEKASNEQTQRIQANSSGDIFGDTRTNVTGKEILRRQMAGGTDTQTTAPESSSGQGDGQVTAGLDSLLQGTESTRPMNRGETARPQAADPLAELSGAKQAGEAEQAQEKMGFNESDSEALSGLPRSQAGPLPTQYGALTGAQMPAASPAWSGQVRTLSGIRQHLLESVGLPAVGVGRFQNALGIYRRTPESVRLQAINDIPVLAHEVGHAVHFRVLSPNAGGKAEAWGGRYDGELMPLGRNTSRSSYTPEQVRKEGVAEFTRLWLTNRVEAIKAAPAFSNHWETELQTRNPKMAEALRESQRRIADYIAMPEFEKAKAQISFDPAAESVGMKTGQWLRKFYAQTVNTLQPALDTVRRAAELDPTQAAKAAEAEMWMENHRGGWASKAHEDVFGHQTDLQGNRVGTGLQTILKDLKPGEHESFSAYLALKRAGELEGRGMRSGFENGKLPQAEMQALEARFEPTRQKLIKWQRNGRDLLVQAGLLDSQSALAMDKANADYVPFYRVYEKLNGVSFGPENSKNAGGYVDLNSGIQRIKGSDRAIIDPLQSAMKNAYMFRKIAEQNHIGVQFFDLMRKVQGHGQWSEQIRPKMKQTTITHDQIAEKLVQEGVIADVTALPQNADLTLRLYEAIKKPDTKNGEVIIFKNGERQHWEVKDPLLMEALKYADADAAKLGNIPSWMLKLFTAPTRALRWGATGGPWFAIPNMIRDTVQGGVFSGSRKFVPFMDTVLGGMEVMRKGGQFERWKEAGGQFSGQVTGTQAFTRLIEDALPKDPLARRALQGLADPQAWRGGFRNALDMVGAFGRFSEQATRVGEFMRGKEAGLSDMAAANLSKTLSLNFARAGETSRVLNQFVPFFNATVQGLDQFMRMHLDPKTRGATVMKGLTYITAPSLAVWALGKDDPEIQNLSEATKNLFWNINLKPMAAAMGMPDSGFILSIPKPFLLGAVYGTSLERALDYATDRDPNGARKAAANILRNTLNPMDVMMSIGGIRPIIESQTGYDLFMKRDIVPVSMQHLPAPQQYSITTSQTAKMLGQFSGQSPMMIDHLLRGYFASAAKFGTDAIDYGMAKMALTDVPMPATKGMMELPILNRFAGSPYMANAFVERFYKASQDMEGKLAVLNKQTDQMSTTEQQKWWQQNQPEVSHYLRTVDHQTNRTGAGDIRKAQARLGEITGAMKDIQASRVLAPEVKRDQLIELTRQRNELAEDGFKSLFPAEVKKRHY